MFTLRTIDVNNDVSFIQSFILAPIHPSIHLFAYLSIRNSTSSVAVNAVQRSQQRCLKYGTCTCTL